jgi:2,3-bisphosphoglycerate-independent phosphoglycerate mutase
MMHGTPSDGISDRSWTSMKSRNVVMEDHLHEAARQGQLQTVQQLLEAGADVNATSILGFNPLYTAAGRGHHNVVKLLLAAGANFNAADPIGRTPLCEAARGIIMRQCSYWWQQGPKSMQQNHSDSLHCI